MALWHLDEIRNELLRNKWNVIDENSGDGYRVSGKWVVQHRSGKALTLEFEGLDEERTLLIERSYGVHLQEDSSVSLYIPKNKPSQSKPNALKEWKEALSSFIGTMNSMLGYRDGTEL